MLTNYAEALLARKAAIDGTQQRILRVSRTGDNVRLTAYAKSLVAKKSGQLIQADFRHGANFNALIKRATLADLDKFTRTMTGREKQTFIVQVRNRYTGKVVAVKCKSVTEANALKNVRAIIEAHETVLGVVA